MLVNEIRGFIFEIHYNELGFSKENSFYLIKQQKKNLQLFEIKLTEKGPHPHNAKGHY